MPRSESRDLADRLAGHRRYFRHWTSLEKWKLYLAVAATLGAFGWAVASFFGKSLSYQTTRGPLANVHQAWDADCTACHNENAKGNHWFDAAGKWNDFKCQSCHSGAAHHASVKDEYQNESCAKCHHDHNGKDFSLVRMSDNHCTRCHDGLAKYTDPSKRPAGDREYAQVVTHFDAKNHPPFAGLPAEKERKLKFSHSLHMVPGIVVMKDAANAKTAKDYGGKYRKENQGDDALLQLDCASCHQLDPGRGGKDFKEIADAPSQSILPVRPGGANFLPINYDAHCRSCHPTEAPPVKSASGGAVASFAVPHRLQPEKLETLLSGEYAQRLMKEQPGVWNQKRMIDLHPDKDPEMKSFMDDLNAKAKEAANSLLVNGCVKCHEGAPTKIDPPAIPQVWLTHARFDHTAHRATDCKTCHDKAYAKYKGDETIRDDRNVVKIDGLQSCVNCHSPRNGDKGGVRHGCTDCHSYHHGDYPLQGRGAPALGPPTPQYSIDDFLRGR